MPNIKQNIDFHSKSTVQSRMNMSLKNSASAENLPTAPWMAFASENPLYIQQP